MPEDKEVLNSLEQFALSQAHNVLLDFDLEFDKARQEDIAQTLFLAGWSVWQSTRKIEFAMNRIKDRAKSEAMKLHTELTQQPKPLSSIGPFRCGRAGGGGDGDGEFSETTSMPFRRVRRGPEDTGDPAEEVLVREYLMSLPERRRRILQCRMAMMTNEETAQELGISRSTVDRELEALRKDKFHDRNQ